MSPMRFEVRILVAEDERLGQMVAAGMLEAFGCRVDLARDGGKAVEMSGQNPYDLIFLDLSMPVMDGIEAARAIRGRERGGGRRIPLIAMTGHTREEERERCRAAGMDDFLSKPITAEDMGALLSRWLAPRPPGEEEGDGEEGRRAAQPPSEAEGKQRREGEETEPGVHLPTLLKLGRLQEEDEDDVVKEMAEIFLREAPRHLSAIRESMGRADAASMEVAAHTLKGSSTILGARRMAALSGGLEEMAAAGEVLGAGPRLAQLEAEFRRVRRELEAEPWKR
ncbi:MAG: response regulator [bacterium]